MINSCCCTHLELEARAGASGNDERVGRGARLDGHRAVLNVAHRVHGAGGLSHRDVGNVQLGGVEAVPLPADRQRDLREPRVAQGWMDG
jgi:hypothetical protein